MQKPSRTLLDTITNRAKTTFRSPYEVAYHEDWVKHWFNTARQFRDELNQEGLPATVSRVDELIDEQQKIVDGSSKWRDVVSPT